MIGAPAYLAPLFVEVALTFALLFWLGVRRVDAVTSGGVHPRDVALRQPNWPSEITKIGNAYQSQLELPVLFYLVVVLSLFTAQGTTTLLVLAWAFVATRIFHALIHVTTNHMRRRFFVFLAGSLIVMTMWILFGLDLFFGA
jgi:hypothetical protein